MSKARSPAPVNNQELFQPGSPEAKWLKSVSPGQKNDTDKADPHANAVTPRPNAARQLFPQPIAPTALIAPASKEFMSPIQRRAQTQRGTGERQAQLTAAAAAVAAAVTEATKLLEEAFDKASEDRVNDKTAVHPAALIPAPLPTTQPNDIQANNQSNDNNTNNTTNPLQQEQLTANPITPRQEIDKTSLL